MQGPLRTLTWHGWARTRGSRSGPSAGAAGQDTRDGQDTGAPRCSAPRSAGACGSVPAAPPAPSFKVSPHSPAAAFKPRPCPPPPTRAPLLRVPAEAAAGARGWAGRGRGAEPQPRRWAVPCPRGGSCCGRSGTGDGATRGSALGVAWAVHEHRVGRSGPNTLQIRPGGGTDSRVLAEHLSRREISSAGHSETAPQP